MAAEKAWLKAFTSGSKALQDRLRKVHAKNPEFQSFLGKHGFDGGSSVKQASKAQTVSKEVAAKRAELSDKAYGATTGAKVGGDHVELKDTIAPLTKDQHSKVQVAKKAALTKDERIAAIARASRKATSKYDVPTEERDDAGYEDMRDLHHSLHIGRGSSLDEEAQKHRIEVTMSNPNHPAVTKRDERFSRVVRVTASNPEKALHAGWDHYKKKGYKVHEAEHIGMVSEASMKGMPFTDAEKARLAKYDQADKQKINKRVTTRKYEGDDAYSHAVFVDGKPVITGLHKSQVKHYMKQASDKLNEEVVQFPNKKEQQKEKHKADVAGLKAQDEKEHKDLHQLVSAWYHNDEHPAIEKRIGKHGYEVGKLEDDEHGGAFVVKKGDVNGDSYRQWTAKELHKAKAVEEEVELDEAKAVVSTNKPVGYTITDAGSGKVEKSGTLTPDDLPKTKTVMHKGEKVTIPAHKAPKSGFNKFGKFATLDKVEEAKDLSKDLKKRVELVTGGDKTLVRNKSGVLVARKAKDGIPASEYKKPYYNRFDESSNEIIEEGFDDPKEIAQHLADTHGAKNVRPEHVIELARDSNRAVDVESVMKHIKGLQEEVKQLDEVDMDFVQNFIAGGLALQGIDYAKKKLGDVTKKAYDKYMSKKAKDSAPAQTAVSEASLAADIQRDVDARNKRLSDAAAKAKKKKAAEAKAASAAKQAKEMDKLKNLSKYGSDEEKEYAKGELQRIRGLEEAIKGGIGDVDGMRSFVRGTLPKSCPTCYGRKSMYVTPKGEMYADKKTEDSKRVACPDCKGKGYVAEESNHDSNYLNNKKNQIRESILGKLAAKMGKK